MKRPLVWLGLAYVFGEILVIIIGRTAFPLTAVLSAATGLAGMYSGRMQKSTGAHQKRVCPVLLFGMLPVFMLLGAGRLYGAQKEAEDWWQAGDSEAAVTVLCDVAKTVPKSKSLSIYVKNVSAAADDAPDNNQRTMIVPERILVVYDGQKPVRSGNRLLVHGHLKRFSRASNMGVYDAWKINSAQALYHQLFAEKLDILDEGRALPSHQLSKFKERMTDVYRALLDSESAGVLCAIMFGDTQQMTPELKQLYQSQGIGHLFAVSGLHMSLAGMGVYKMLRHLTMKAGHAFTISLCLMLAYSLMCGMPVSCIRAMVMAGMVMLAEVLGRSYDGPSALALAALWLLWRQPQAVTAFGVWRSFGAVGALIGFVPIVRRFGQCQGLSAAVVPTLCVTLLTTPLVAWFMYEIPVYSMILNVLLLPLMSILFSMAAAGGVMGLFWPLAGKFLLGIVYYVLQLYEGVCTAFSKLPFAIVVSGRPPVWVMLFVCMVMPVLYVALVRQFHGKTLPLGGLCVAAVYLLLGLPKIPDESRIIFIDVGQGDCALISMTDGTNWMIDGGSSSQKEVGKYTIEKVLKYYGIARLDGVFLSHMDSDHTNGIRQLMAGDYQIDRLYVPELCPSAEKLETLRAEAAAKGIHVEVMPAGGRLDMDEVLQKDKRFQNWSIECLHPSKTFATTEDNEASMILLLHIEDFRILFTGDGEMAAEAGVMSKVSDIHLLKAGHHGSKESSSEKFLKKICPKAAIISCAQNNRYGHPHHELIERLEKAGCKYFVTAQCGALTVKFGHARFSIQPYVKP